MYFLKRKPVAHVYQRVCASSFTSTFWRRKWPILIALVSCVILTVTLVRVSIVRETNAPKRDTYLDDVPEDFYRESEHSTGIFVRSLRETIPYITKKEKKIMGSVVIIYSIAQVVRLLRR